MRPGQIESMLRTHGRVEPLNLPAADYVVNHMEHTRPRRVMCWVSACMLHLRQACVITHEIFQSFTQISSTISGPLFSSTVDSHCSACIIYVCSRCTRTHIIMCDGNRKSNVRARRNRSPGATQTRRSMRCNDMWVGGGVIRPVRKCLRQPHTLAQLASRCISCWCDRVWVRVCYRLFFLLLNGLIYVPVWLLEADLYWPF